MLPPATPYSSIDLPKPTLDPDIWDPDTRKMYPRVRHFIVDNLLRHLSKYYKAPERWVARMVMIGSETGKQWTPDGDIDVTMVVDKEAFRNFEGRKLNYPEIVGELMERFFDPKDGINEVLLPGTEHPVNYFVATPGERILADAIYDVINDEWLKENTLEIPDNFDVEVLFPDAWRKAQSWAEKIDLDLGSLRRDLLELFALSRDLKNLPEEDKGKFEEVIQRRIQEIESDLEILVGDYDTVRHERLRAFARQKKDLGVKLGAAVDFFAALRALAPDKSWGDFVIRFIEMFNMRVEVADPETLAFTIFDGQRVLTLTSSTIQVVSLPAFLLDDVTRLLSHLVADIPGLRIDQAPVQGFNAGKLYLVKEERCEVGPLRYVRVFYYHIQPGLLIQSTGEVTAPQENLEMVLIRLSDGVCLLLPKIVPFILPSADPPPEDVSSVQEYCQAMVNHQQHLQDLPSSYKGELVLSDGGITIPGAKDLE